MTTCLSLLCVSCLGVCQFESVFFPFVLEDGMWDLIVLVPDHCLSSY